MDSNRILYRVKIVDIIEISQAHSLKEYDLTYSINEMEKNMVREFNNKDLDVVMKIWLDTNTNAHDFIPKNYWQNNYEEVERMLPEAEIFVYENNHKIQGFIGLMDHYIAGIFIDSECQSKGIGKALLDQAKKIRSDLSLQVYKNNEGAVRFYVREGFTVVREQVDENTGETELVMEWAK
jgi:ribosomal protein S18 acetylase RimI-like enzyme